MKKIDAGVKNFMYPMPTTLVGANVGGKPNYITIAHVGILHSITVPYLCTRAIIPMPGSRKTGLLA